MLTKKWFLAPEWLHSSAHSGQAEPDGGGQLPAAERGDAQCRVPAGHHAPAPGLTGGAARHRGPAHFQTGQRQSGEQGVKSDLYFHLQKMFFHVWLYNVQQI